MEYDMPDVHPGKRKLGRNAPSPYVNDPKPLANPSGLNSPGS